MKVLLINKFLHPAGGAETYIFRLGEILRSHGHEVQYFGMEHKGRCVGNAVGAYTSEMDFHGGSKLAKLTYPIKTIYSAQARRKIRRVLEDFCPDVCHLNNFNYQLTPSVILEIRKWERERGHRVKILYTAHDVQLVCPNHMMRDLKTDCNCEKCGHGSFINCAKNRCIHGSYAKSIIGTLEATLWNRLGIYGQLDAILCPSAFVKSRLDYNPVFAAKTVLLQNFMDQIPWRDTPKGDYVLYFGRFSREKGVATLAEVCRQLPEIPFVFAGSGPLEGVLEGIPNVKNVGFQTGEDLEMLVRRARFSVCPSQCYENCPFSVIESQMYGTPVLGAKIGGIPELIRTGVTGELFESGNRQELQQKILSLWENPHLTQQYSQNCKTLRFETSESYYTRLMELYQ